MHHRLDPGAIHFRRGARLPHLTAQDGTYHAVFRLADSLPREVIDRFREEREALRRQLLGQSAPPHEIAAVLQSLFTRRVEPLLDQGLGECWLRQPPLATLVLNALRFFDRERYILHAACVMPNHVHAIVRPAAGRSLSSVIQSWKGYTAHAANQLLSRRGAFWQEEYYDHLIRDQRDFENSTRYVLNNPVKARLIDWPWTWSRHEPGPIVR